MSESVVELPNGGKLLVRTSDVETDGGERRPRDVSLRTKISADELSKTVEGIGLTLKAAFDRVRPKSAKMELGLEISAKSGELMALLVDADSKADLRLTLEWGYPSGD